MYRNAERYGDNLKTFYVGNTNIMKEDEKQKLQSVMGNQALLEKLMQSPQAKALYEKLTGKSPQ